MSRQTDPDFIKNGWDSCLLLPIAHILAVLDSVKNKA